MKQTYKISFKNGCPVINDGKYNALIDLGSPVSFARDNIIINLGGVNFNLRQDTGNMRTVQEVLGSDVTALIGLDVLNGHNVTIDYKGEKFIFDDDETATVNQGALMGWYTIDLNINGCARKVYVDTGAHYSYLLPELVPPFEADEPACWIHDKGFFGEINARANQCPVKFACKRWSMLFGEIPSDYINMLQGRGIAGVIGADLFNRFKLQISADHKIQFTANE